MVNKVKKIKKKYIVLFLILGLLFITPFTYSKYISKHTKHIVISAIQSGYVVEFDANTGEGSMDPQIFEVGTAQTLSPSTFTKEGYVFLNWNTEPDGTGTSYEDEQEVNNLTTENHKVITLYAIYVREKYIHTGEIKFDGKDGENQYIDTHIYLFNEENINKDFEVSFEIINRGTSTAYENGDYPTMMSAMDEGGAPWPGMVYRVFSDWDDQLVINSSESAKIGELFHKATTRKVTLKRINGTIYLSINDGALVQLLDASAMPTFDYPVVFGASYDGNMRPQRWFDGTLSNLKVIVKDPNTEVGTIKYYANGGTGNDFSQHVLPNKTYKLRKNTYTRVDYVFDCWTTNRDGTGDRYEDEQEVTNLVGSGQNIDLYAQWKTYKYTVKFHANNGTDSVVSQEIDGGATTNLQLNELTGFEKAGYSFAFWNTKANGSGVSYEDGESVKNLGIEENQVVDLYAMYETFSYHSDGDLTFDGETGLNPYINTNIYLFSRKNIHKDFRISFKIKEYRNTRDYNTIVSSLDESGDPWPGFVFRINSSDEIAESTDQYNFEVNSIQAREVQMFPSLTTKTVVIRRELDKLFLELDGGGETQVIDYSTIARSFYYPLTVGASLDKDFEPWRHFYGTISELDITLSE